MYTLSGTQAAVVFLLQGRLCSLSMPSMSSLIHAYTDDSSDPSSPSSIRNSAALPTMSTSSAAISASSLAASASSLAAAASSMAAASHSTSEDRAPPAAGLHYPASLDWKYAEELLPKNLAIPPTGNPSDFDVIKVCRVARGWGGGFLGQRSSSAYNHFRFDAI